MKIVDRKTLMKQPPGTLYSEYSPCIFEPLCIKGETIKGSDGEDIDWFYQPIHDAIDSTGSADFFEQCDAAVATGSSLRMDFDCQSRGGFFDDKQLYAVWEKIDVEALIVRLQTALAGSTVYSPPPRTP